jgi:hypothetical protein
MSSLTRRRFLREASLLAAAAVWPRTATHIRALRIALIDDAGERARARRDGVTLGIEEAKHSAAMFGGAVELAILSARAADLSRYDALIGDDAASLADAAQRAHVPYLNVGSEDDALRGARCGSFIFHVAPSATMSRDAVAGAGTTAARAVAWDASLDRFGADTLNQRFAARFHTPMSADAWLGWFAVKALWESSLRTRSTASEELREYLARESTQFDGHKGRPLSFRAWDRQLRQPLYLPNGERLLEWPPAATAEESARESLDRIGVGASASECRS